MPKFVPSLKDLPEPPPEKQGWPWTEESEPLPPQMPDGSSWPQISIVTPSYNQGCFIEETIRSILLQGYPNLQYIVIDGGSTDQTVEIIRKYEPWLDYWESKKDNGQVDAINKGLELVDGEIFNWINSDDYLAVGALGEIGYSFGQADILAGKCRHFWEGTSKEKILATVNLDYRTIIYQPSWIRKFDCLRCRYQQPGVWLKPSLVKQCGGLDIELHYRFDHELMYRYLVLFDQVRYIDYLLAHFRLHESSKTVNSMSQTELFQKEQIKAVRKLMNVEKFSAAHYSCQLYLREQDWLEMVSQIRKDDQLSKWRKRLKILSLIFQDPRIRLSRLSLGAIRRI